MPGYRVRLNESATNPQCDLAVFGPDEGEQVLRIRWTRSSGGFHIDKVEGPAADRFSEEQVFDMIEAANRCLNNLSRKEDLEEMVNGIMQGN